MRAFRTLGLVVGGGVLGVGMMLAGSRLGAQTPQVTPNRPDTPSGRIVASPLEYAEHYAFRFFFDTATGTCYFAGVSRSSGDEITAITPTAASACAKGR